jgi:hypothetical protein
MMILFGLLPICALLLTILLYRRSGHDGAESVLLGSVAWLFSIALGSEALGLVAGIRFVPFLSAWIIGIAILIALHARLPRSARPAIAIKVERFALSERLALAVLGTIAGATLLIALVCPPNNWDSQTYHLPRVEHWIQDHSFAYYPTKIGRQIDYQYFAEVVLLQLRPLSGTERLDNLVQWLAALGTMVAVARIASRLGASRRGAILAAVVAATMPILILESTNTKNDVVVAFLLLCTVERLLAWQESQSLQDAAYMAMVAGLALATKGTAYPIGAPLGVWFLAAALLRRGSKGIPQLLICGLLVLLPNVAFYARNLAYYGKLFSDVGQWTNNAAFGVGPLVLNVVRHVAVNLASFDDAMNRWGTAVVIHLLKALSLDPNDPATTLPGTTFELLRWQNHEDYAGNSLQLLLSIIAIIAAVRAQAWPGPRRGYAVMLVVSALLFVIVLRWQPWITRLQLPLFALAAPLIGCMPVIQKRERIAIPLTILLALYATPALLLNQIRPLLRSDQLGIARSILSETSDQIRFASRPGLLPQYEEVARYALANGDHDIGLLTGGDDWEYPLWRVLERARIEPLRIEHIYSASSSGQSTYPLGPFKPTLIIATVPERPPVLPISGFKWMRKVEFPDLSIYVLQAR